METHRTNHSGTLIHLIFQFADNAANKLIRVIFVFLPVVARDSKRTNIAYLISQIAIE